MWRGFLSSCRYSVICWSERWRPNQVFHQNRNGISTISQPVTKNRSFCVGEMLRLGFGTSWSGVEMEFSDWTDIGPRLRKYSRLVLSTQYSVPRYSVPDTPSTNPERTITHSYSISLLNIRVEDALLFEVVRHGVLGQKRRL